MSRIVYLVILGLLFVHTNGISQGNLKEFSLSDVKVENGPFYNAQMTDLDYILEMDVDRLLAPFLIDAGLEPKAETYGNWENSGLNGHIGGHYLTALAQMYASTGNREVLDRLNYMLEQLAACQQKNGNGYIGGIPGGQEVWQEIANGNIDAGNFSLNDKWVPLYNIHKLFAGLRDVYLITGNEQAKDMLIELSDWMYGTMSGLSEEQMQDMLRSEHGGLNEVFADVSVISGDRKYMELARKFSDRRILNPLLEKEDSLTGLHANTQIPKVIGYQRIGNLDGDSEWEEAAEFFWNTVVENRTVSIGGNSVREHFNPVNDFSSMIESNQGPETCNTYNMLRLSRFLFLSSGDPKYIDFYERGLFNHILSSQHPDGGFVYFTPMRPRHFRVYSQPHQSFWCCVGSGLENHGKYSELIYAHDEENLYVNLYMSSTVQWEEKGLSARQVTKFPFEETSRIEIELEQSRQFSLKLRVPDWVGEGGIKVQVNGEEMDIPSSPSSYATIEREWESGDIITVGLHMETRTEYMPDGSPWVSFIHGPIVLGAITDTTDLGGMWADDSRMGHVANDKFYPLDEAPMLVVEDNVTSTSFDVVQDAPLSFRITSPVYPEKFQDLKLVPFFTIHSSRYMIYWPVLRREDLAARIAALREKEREKMLLESRIVDQVAPGEQQPESEHGFEGDETTSGLFQGRFWRAARGSFSYELSDPDKKSKVLRITYYGGERNRNFDIYLDGQLLAGVDENSSASEGFYDVDYPIPAELLKTNMKITFKAREGSMTRSIYGVRLLKDEIQ